MGVQQQVIYRNELQRHEQASIKDELSTPRLKKHAHQKLEHFNELLHSNIPKGRQVLRKLLRDSIG
jgi:hypothetical protein